MLATIALAQVIPHRVLSEAQFMQIATLKNQVWSYGIDEQIRYLEERTEPDDRHILLSQNGDLVGYLRITTRFAFSDKTYWIDGVSTVIVSSQHRGSGYGRELMKAASSDILATTPHRTGALCCSDEYIDFYKKCGWELSDRAFVRAYKNESFFKDSNAFTFNAESDLPRIVRIAGRPI